MFVLVVSRQVEQELLVKDVCVNQNQYFLLRFEPNMNRKGGKWPTKETLTGKL